MLIEIAKADHLKRVVIVGGGFAGITLAKKLSHKKFQVVIIDKNNHHTFQPLLYQVATAALEPSSIAYPIRKILNSYPNIFFRMGDVNKIDAENNCLHFDNDHIFYDYLVVCTGAKTNYFGNTGLMINSLSMKNLVEAIDMRNLVLQNFEKSLCIINSRKIASYRTIVIAGAGPTGVELAGSFGELKRKVISKDFPEIPQEDIKIILVHSGNRVLPMLSEKSSAKALNYLLKLGVEVRLNTRVVDVNGDYIETNTGEDIIARTLIWTAGVTGEPVEGLNKEVVNKNNRYLVDNYNKIINTKNIYALGDVAAMYCSGYENGHPQVAPVAIQQASLLSKNLMNLENNLPLKPFKYKDKGSMATIGKNKAVVEMGRFRFGGFFAWAIWMFVHLMSLVGYRNRIVVFFNWAKNYFNNDRAIRLIIRPFNLQKMRRERKQNLDENISI